MILPLPHSGVIVGCENDTFISIGLIKIDVC